MVQFLCKKILSCRGLLRNQDLGFLQIHHFSTLSKTLPESDKSEEAINYLTCGLSPTQFESLNSNSLIPGSVISFLRNQPSIHPDTANLVRNYPRTTFNKWDLVEGLLSRIEYFMSIGLSTHDIAFMGPDVLGRSLEKEFKPLYKYISTLLPSGNAAVCFKRLCLIQLFDLENVVIPNIRYLGMVEIPRNILVKLLTDHPYAISFKHDHFKKSVDIVISLGFLPESNMFPRALFAVAWNTESEWRKKVEIFESFGLSFDVLKSVLQKFPFCMVHSADSISTKMDFLVNRMGFKPSFVMQWPPVFYHSLEEWIVPRCVVYEALFAKRLVERIVCLSHLLKIPEDDFLSTFVDPFKAQIPGLLKMYNQKRATCLVEASITDAKLKAKNNEAKEIVAD